MDRPSVAKLCCMVVKRSHVIVQYIKRLMANSNCIDPFFKMLSQKRFFVWTIVTANLTSTVGLLEICSQGFEASLLHRANRICIGLAWWGPPKAWEPISNQPRLDVSFVVTILYTICYRSSASAPLLFQESLPLHSVRHVFLRSHTVARIYSCHLPLVESEHIHW